MHNLCSLACGPELTPNASCSDQGEANSDEGYHRSTSEYACEFEHLITSWRAAWGYTIPFFWVQLHPWGPGGETRTPQSPELVLLSRLSLRRLLGSIVFGV